MVRLAFALAALISAALLLSYGMASEPNPALSQKRPNVFFILTDDQDPESLRRMAHVQELLVREGTSFANTFATTLTCCPSRVSYQPKPLRGGSPGLPLPLGYRPDTYHNQPAQYPASLNLSYFRVDPPGEARAYHDHVSLDGVSFGCAPSGSSGCP